MEVTFPASKTSFAVTPPCPVLTPAPPLPMQWVLSSSHFADEELGTRVIKPTCLGRVSSWHEGSCKKVLSAQVLLSEALRPEA